MPTLKCSLLLNHNTLTINNISRLVYRIKNKRVNLNFHKNMYNVQYLRPVKTFLSIHAIILKNSNTLF